MWRRDFDISSIYLQAGIFNDRPYRDRFRYLFARACPCGCKPYLADATWLCRSPVATSATRWPTATANTFLRTSVRAATVSL